MSFLSKLTIDNKSYNILEFSYSCHQTTDPTGRPHGVTRGGQFQIKIESDGKTGFIEWMLSPAKTKDGSITFYKRDAMSKLQEIKFEKGYCINFSEHFNSKNAEPLITEITVSARKISFDDITFENSWKM